MNYNYKIFSPSGNDTALVMHKVSSKEDKITINNIIMEKHNNVEQVGFMYMENGIPSLEMAGGEFCGNASRCMAYEYLKGNKGTVEIKISGTYNILNAGINDDKNVWCEIPLKSSDFNSIIKIIDEDTSVVSLSGITHIIKNNFDTTLTPVEFKQEALKILEEHNFLKTKIAAGVIFTDIKDKISINPVVWVSGIDTLFYENACGSGTTALGVDFAFRQNKSIDIPVYQPSGHTISCKVDVLHDNIVNCSISGKIENIYEGFLSYNDFTKK